MAKGGMKLRISRLISSSFQSCRSKHPSILPHHPVPSFPPPGKPRRSSSFNHPFTSVGCGCDTTEFKWQQNKKWHVIAKVYDDTPPRQKIYNSSDHDLFPLPPPLTLRKRPTSRKKKKKVGIVVRSSSEVEMSVLRKLIPCRKVKESCLAVVKRSEDPLGDFKRSMVEMIVEKHMFQERELESLLECFLSLNSRQHHGVIVQAFAQIWEALFGCASSSSSDCSIPQTRKK